jgi:[protein-PII] uridylyltransferase
MNHKELKARFYRDRERIFSDEDLLRDSYKFCVQLSLLVEEYIQKIVKPGKYEFVLASVGGFSRRELSPYSDIDIMFISKSVEDDKEKIQKIIQDLWDCGIEASHTVREFNDIKKFLEDDLHSFTQFFETRFLLGNEPFYWEMNKELLGCVTEENKRILLKRYFDDVKLRHEKYGSSAKELEPNVKYTAGGLRDLQVVEWTYSIKNNLLLLDQKEITQTESFLNHIKNADFINPKAVSRLYESYKYILNVRNHLHLLSGAKNDRLEFTSQEKLSVEFGFGNDPAHQMMKKYFECSNIIKRFENTVVKRFSEDFSGPISNLLAIQLDDDFYIKGNVISTNGLNPITLSMILRAFYYRGFYDARFDEAFRSIIIEKIVGLEEYQEPERESSVFFREILRLNKNVGKTLMTMNELGVLGAFLPEFKDLVGFFQPGVYHCYTADEHTLIALNTIESLDDKNFTLYKIFHNIKRRDLLYLGILFHDIAKPISIGGHEIIGGEIASTIMERLGYDQKEIAFVQFLVRHHLTMEQVAFRRNLFDPSTLNKFSALFADTESLDYLYLLTYSDLSAVSPQVWTQWKSDLLYDLYLKTKTMLQEKMTGEDLLLVSQEEAISDSEFFSEESIKNHIESINDLAYLQQYSQEEINQHIEEIEKGSSVSVFIKTDENFTGITVITRDSESLLSRLCGALSINDLNIHDARIYTRKDGIVIDFFNVSDFRSGQAIEELRYDKIKEKIEQAVKNELQIVAEFNNVKSKWWRIENKFFKRKGRVKVSFEKHDKYTIIDVYSPDRLGLLYQITREMNELGLSIYFAKIATQGDDVVDSFYVLDRYKRKVSVEEYELITLELTETIKELL